MRHPLSTTVGLNFTDKQLSLGRYSGLRPWNFFSSYITDLQIRDMNLSNVCTFKIVVLMNMMADNSFKILVHYGEFNEVMFVSMTSHQVIHCTAVVLHTFLQKAKYLYTWLECSEHQFGTGLQETNFLTSNSLTHDCNNGGNELRFPVNGVVQNDIKTQILRGQFLK
jgi:hypothetical protein